MLCHGCSAIVGIIYGIIPASRIIIFYVGTFYGIAYIFFAIITYTVTGRKIRLSRHMRRTSNDISMSWRFYLVSVLIVVTFIFFYAIPLVIRAGLIRYNYNTPLSRNRVLVHEGLTILVCIGLMSDAAIYTFLKKEFREVVLDLFSSCKRNMVTNTSHSQTRPVSEGDIWITTL